MTNKNQIKRIELITKAIVMVILFYVLFLLTTNTVKANTNITGYKKTVTITIEDGLNKVDRYLVMEDTLKNVLNKLNIKLKNEDTINKDLNYVVKNKDVIEIKRVSKTYDATQEQVPYSTEVKKDGLNLFTTEVIQQGSVGVVEKVYENTYLNKVLKIRKLHKETLVVAPKNTIVSTGIVQSGAYFTGKLTYYGGDAAGSYNTSSSGVSLSASSGVMGSNSPYLVIGGQKYFCLAADSSIPFGTVIKISNHKLSLPSTIYGIVVDRGGAIKQNKIDIFVGSEKGGIKYFTGGTSHNTKFEIVSVGSGRNFWKAYY